MPNDRVRAKLYHLERAREERQVLLDKLKEINARRDRAKASFAWIQRLYFHILVLAFAVPIVLPDLFEEWAWNIAVIIVAFFWPVPWVYLERALGRTPAQLLAERVHLEFELLTVSGIFDAEDVPKGAEARMRMWQMKKELIRSINKDPEGAIRRFEDEDQLRDWQIYANLA